MLKESCTMSCESRMLLQHINHYLIHILCHMATSFGHHIISGMHFFKFASHFHKDVFCVHSYCILSFDTSVLFYGVVLGVFNPLQISNCGIVYSVIN